MSLIKLKKLSIVFLVLIMALGLFAASAMAGESPPPPGEVWVSVSGDDSNDGTAGSPFATIQKGINEVAEGGTVYVAAGEYVEVGQIIINKDLTIVGADKLTTIIKPAQDTGSSGDARGWILVPDYETEFNLSNITLDGEGKNIHQAIRSYGTGTIDNNIIKNMRYSSNMGFGIAVFGNMVISNNTISNIERVGISIFDMSLYLSGGGGDPKADNVIVEGNTIIGKGPDADVLGYGIELDCGAKATISGNTFSNWGPDTTDWASAGILVHDAFSVGVAAEATITGNTFENNEYGLYVGHYENDASIVTATGNTFVNNYRHVRYIPGAIVNLEAILANNNFDRAVVVRGSGIKVPAIFSSIQHAIDAAEAGDTIDVAGGTYIEEGQIIIDKDLSIAGEDKFATIIKPASDTPSTHLDPDSGWVVVKPGAMLNLSNVTLDGEGKTVLYGIHCNYGGGGTISNSIIKNIRSSHYVGLGIALQGSMTVYNNQFENIQRVGVWVAATHAKEADSENENKDSVITGNTFTGMGEGDNLNYGVEIGRGAGATIIGNTFSNYRGIAASDGSGSAAILVTDYYGQGTEAFIYKNTMTDNLKGIHVGYLDTDESVVAAFYNRIYGNDTGIVNVSTAVGVAAILNWWGHHSGPGGEGPGSGDTVSANVTYDPWLLSGGFEVIATEDSTANLEDIMFIDVGEDGTVIVAILNPNDFPEIGVPGGMQVMPGEFPLFQILSTVDTAGETVRIEIDIAALQAEIPGLPPASQWRFFRWNGETEEWDLLENYGVVGGIFWVEFEGLSVFGLFSQTPPPALPPTGRAFPYLAGVALAMLLTGLLAYRHRRLQDGSL